MDVKRVSAALATERKTQRPPGLRRKWMKAGPLERESDQDRGSGGDLGLEGKMRSLLKKGEDRGAEEGAVDPLGEKRKEVLTRLARNGGWVDFHDLPLASPTSRGWARRFLEVMKNEGILVFERNGTYPNMISLRITSRGQEELRDQIVGRAAFVLDRREGQVAERLGKSRQGLRRVDGNLFHGLRAPHDPGVNT